LPQFRTARAETEANERVRRARAEIEDRFIGLKADLAQAELRADRAEQWLVLIRREIEDHLMPSFAAITWLLEKQPGPLAREPLPAKWSSLPHLGNRLTSPSSPGMVDPHGSRMALASQRCWYGSLLTDSVGKGVCFLPPVQAGDQSLG
jgi:hypothetical protein